MFEIVADAFRECARLVGCLRGRQVDEQLGRFVRAKLADRFVDVGLGVALRRVGQVGTQSDVRVLLNAELAVRYGVTTKRLNEQVKRNADRFPDAERGIGGTGRSSAMSGVR
jgi:hypothetical protein